MDVLRFAWLGLKPGLFMASDRNSVSTGKQVAGRKTGLRTTQPMSIMARVFGVFRWSVVVLAILAGIAVMFFASVEQLSANSGRVRGGGHIFVALVSLVGEPIARGLTASLLFLCAWLLGRPIRPNV